jgi:hypothetical protein
MSTKHKRRDQAARVVLEIVCQSPGDEIVGKGRLFKAFYYAHLFYAVESAGFLTDWPIVKMPEGPGIHDFRKLIDSLIANGDLETEPAKVGPYKTTKYKAALEKRGSMQQAEVDAVRQAVEFIAEKSAAQLSDITHEFSEAWNSAKMGEELSIYVDLLPDDERESRRQAEKTLERDLQAAWK